MHQLDRVEPPFSRPSAWRPTSTIILWSASTFRVRASAIKFQKSLSSSVSTAYHSLEITRNTVRDIRCHNHKPGTGVRGPNTAMPSRSTLITECHCASLSIPESLKNATWPMISKLNHSKYSLIMIGLFSRCVISCSSWCAYNLISTSYWRRAQ